MFPSPQQVQTWIVDHDPISVVALDDPVIEALGFSAESRYAETYWLPVLGPSTLWALRRLSGLLTIRPSGISVPMGMLASELGLGGNGGRHAPAVRAIGRLVLFGLAEVRSDELAVRRNVPPLAQRQLRRLPSHLVDAHQAHHTVGPARERNGHHLTASEVLREPASRSEPARVSGGTGKPDRSPRRPPQTAQVRVC